MIYANHIKQHAESCQIQNETAFSQISVEFFFPPFFYYVKGKTMRSVNAKRAGDEDPRVKKAKPFIVIIIVNVCESRLKTVFSVFMPLVPTLKRFEKKNYNGIFFWFCVQATKKKDMRGLKTSSCRLQMGERIFLFVLNSRI